VTFYWGPRHDMLVIVPLDYFVNCFIQWLSPDIAV